MATALAVMTGQPHPLAVRVEHPDRPSLQYTAAGTTWDSGAQHWIHRLLPLTGPAGSTHPRL